MNILWLEPVVRVLHEKAEAAANGEIFELGRKYASVNVQIKGIGGTELFTFKGSVDGANYVNIEGVNVTNGTSGATTNADGIFSIPVYGMDKIYIDFTTRDTGVVTVTAVAIPIGVNPQYS